MCTTFPLFLSLSFSLYLSLSFTLSLFLSFSLFLSPPSYLSLSLSFYPSLSFSLLHPLSLSLFILLSLSLSQSVRSGSVATPPPLVRGSFTAAKASQQVRATPIITSHPPSHNTSQTHTHLGTLSPATLVPPIPMAPTTATRHNHNHQ